MRQFITRDTSNRCKVEFNELVGQAVRLIKSDSRALNIPIEFVEGDIPQPLVDRVQIAQVLVNLLRNSVDAITGAIDIEDPDIKHSVCVETKLDGRKILVMVTDTGPGFESVIEPFKAFETSKKSGLGIGLSISRSIIESHDGELWMDRGRKKGCRMLFTLPVKN